MCTCYSSVELILYMQVESYLFKYLSHNLGVLHNLGVQGKTVELQWVQQQKFVDFQNSKKQFFTRINILLAWTGSLDFCLRQQMLSFISLLIHHMLQILSFHCKKVYFFAKKCVSFELTVNKMSNLVSKVLKYLFKDQIWQIGPTLNSNLKGINTQTLPC